FNDTLYAEGEVAFIIDRLKAIEHRVDAHIIDWTVNDTKVVIDASFNAIHDGSIDIRTLNQADGDIVIYYDVTNTSSEPQPDFSVPVDYDGTGNFIFHAAGDILLYNDIEFLGNESIVPDRPYGVVEGGTLLTFIA